MKSLISLMAILLAALSSTAVQARETVIAETISVRSAAAARYNSGYVTPKQREIERRAQARFGPFRVLGPYRAALVGPTDESTTAYFKAMLTAFPRIATLEMVECPGTYDDRSNLRLGRMIRAAGIGTYVPSGGSVRSGAVELFLAGASWQIDDGAQFAVHAWLDDRGHQASDYAANHAEHRKYLAYYKEMGMADHQARAFYAMTNSVPHERARWLGAAEMRRWVGIAQSQQPRLAYLDLGRLVN